MKKILLPISFLILAATSSSAAEVRKKKDSTLVKEMEFASAKKDQNLAATQSEFVVEIKDNKFFPETVEVPANKDFTLIVRNLDKTLEEFESHELRQEKMVKGGKEIQMKIKSLKPGEYKFFGEFHPKTAQGRLVAK